MPSLDALAAIAFAALLAVGLALWPLRAFLRAGGGVRRVGALAIALGAGVAVAGLYGAIGKPGAPGAAHRPRIEALEAKLLSDGGADLSVDEAIAVWKDVARRTPKDPLPHLYAGNLMMRQGDARGAAAAFDAALRRDPQNPTIMVELAVALVAVQGEVGSDALALFEAASARTPDDPRPLLYRAMAAMEAGRDAEAAQLWARVGALLPPDDPRQDMVRRMTGKAP